MEYQVIQRSFFSAGGKALARLDAEFASPSFLSVEQSLVKKFPGDTLGSITGTYNGPIVNAKLKADEEVFHYVAIDSVDTTDGLTYSEALRFEDRPSRAQYVLKADDLLISTVRPNRGAVALLTTRLENAIGSSGFALRRSLHLAKFPQAYIFAFMKTPYARIQLIRRNRGSMYPAVLDADVSEVFIPEPPSEVAQQVAALIKEAVKDHDDFFSAHTEQRVRIESYLTSAVGAPPPDPLSPPLSGISSAIRRYSEFFPPNGALRFDAEFFRGEYDEFYKRMGSVPNRFMLGMHYTGSTGRPPGNPKEDIPYLRQAVLTNAGINWDAVTMESGSLLPSKGRVAGGDILLACTAHEIFYIGRKVDYVRSVPAAYENNNVCVPDLMILRPKDSKPSTLDGAYVAAFLRCPWGLHQVQKCIRGLRGGHVYPRDVEKQVWIPVPEETWLADFAALSHAAETHRNQAKSKVQDAVAVVCNWLAAGGAVSPEAAVVVPIPDESPFGGVGQDIAKPATP